MYRPKRVKPALTTPLIKPVTDAATDSANSANSANKASSKGNTTVTLLWRKKTRKMHKSWEGDGKGVVKRLVNGEYILQISISETQSASAHLGEDLSKLQEGEVLSAGQYEIEVLEVGQQEKKQETMKTGNTVPIGRFNQVMNQVPMKPIKPVKPIKPINQVQIKPIKPIEPVNRVKKGLIKPVASKQTGLESLMTPFISPRTNYRPVIQEATVFNSSMLAPFFQPALRPHQVEAVEFMYNCVLGFKHDLGSGCILADEMGLGKTLSTIACVYTLLKQQLIKNALIVCPATLILNWRDEFRKWVPSNERVGILAFDSTQSNSCLDMFFGPTRSRVYQVLIISYERLRSIEASECFDLMVCDEAHRLKSKKSRTNDALDLFASDKRILLTGTPIQNDLLEFYTLANFANANCLGPERKFATKIENGEGSSMLTEVCDQFMLRRTATVLSKYVTVPKSEHLVFIEMQPEQKQKYIQQTNENLKSIGFNKPASEFLQAITELRKTAFGHSASLSGKMAFLKHFLMELRKTGEKIVLVSGSTRVLDMCQQLCVASRFTWMRLDGSTPQSKRISSVKLFNSLNADNAFVFLLSARSGGAGLNLIGASRLVLLDGDWNPAVDLQVIARIFRDGQKRHCHIYRFLSTNTIDEKIFQRQIHKTDISNSVLETEFKSQKLEFSVDQLRDLFSYTEYVKCNTLETRCGETDLRGFQEPESLDTETVLRRANKAAKNVTCVLSTSTSTFTIENEHDPQIKKEPVQPVTSTLPSSQTSN